MKYNICVGDLILRGEELGWVVEKNQLGNPFVDSWVVEWQSGRRDVILARWVAIYRDKLYETRESW